MKKKRFKWVRISRDSPQIRNDAAYSKYQSVILYICGLIEGATRIRKFAKCFYFQKIPYPL